MINIDKIQKIEWDNEKIEIYLERSEDPFEIHKRYTPDDFELIMDWILDYRPRFVN
jgi:hypothetical protein